MTTHDDNNDVDNDNDKDEEEDTVRQNLIQY